MLHIGWFSTARGNSSRILLNTVIDRIRAGLLDVQVDFVFCSREPGEADNTDIFIKQVNEYRIPLICLSVRKFAQNYKQPIGSQDGHLPEWRLEYDLQVMQRLKNFNCKLSLLAGYMLIVGPEMCQRYDMINLHPALPDGPKGTWQEVIWQLIENKANQSGVMLHLVTPELDRGPVISYCRYPIRGHGFDHLWDEISKNTIEEIKTRQGEGNELFKLIRRKGFEYETPLILHTLTAFSSGAIEIVNGSLFNDKGTYIAGYDLTDEINRDKQGHTRHY